MAQPTRYQAPESPLKNEAAELYEAVQSSKPLYASAGAAVQATIQQLEQLAKQHGMTVMALVAEAHSTRDSKPHHIEALSLERQLGFLRR